MKKTLFVSDLDGTLLGPDQRVSDRSAEIINRLQDKGMLFSYATARSVHTGSVVTKNINFRCPIIAHNGTFIMDNATFGMVRGNFFTEAEAARIIGELDRLEMSHIAYSWLDGAERFSYLEPRVSPHLQDFLNKRINDVRRRAVQHRDELYRGQPYYFNCIDEPQKAWELYEIFKDEFNCVCAPEVYSRDIWLEIMPKSASKASAVMQLKEIVGAEKVVVFGDGMNDMPMFRVADECYAMANAEDELKKAATGVIGSNSEDGVARWLEEKYID
ncbi:MAG: HAD family hydrolase [Clostridia bacterium]|nr:HAD family hydrolase [Clostridia bacterium]